MSGKQPTKPENATEHIAANLAFIARGIKNISEGSLNNKAIDILLYHACGRTIPMLEIRRVLNELENLEKTYLKRGR